jgi:hypothetical protein
MKPEDYSETLLIAHLLAKQCEAQTDNLADAIKAAQHAMTIGPFVDPTVFLRNHDKLSEDIYVLEAVYGLAVKMQNLKNTRRT